MGNKPLIEIKNLVKYYKGSFEPALNDLTLNVYEGEIFGLLGPNGAGKTTTISILCGLLLMTSGEVTIAGHKLKDEVRKIKTLIGVVSQDIALYDNLTAYENLKYFGSLYGMNSKHLDEKINVSLERLGLLKQGNTRIKKFSGGMKRRINLLAGILHEPLLLFLDEPTVGVDAQTRRIILDYLKDLNNNGTTIMYSSHLLDEAEKFCSNIVIIDYGEIICSGSPGEIVKSQKEADTLEDVFIELTGRKVRD